MRILIFFLKFSFFAGIVGALIYLFGGTLWLKIGTYGFLQDAMHLPLYNHDIATYNQICQQAPGSSENSQVYAFQIRFINDQEYSIEVVCTLIENSPIEIKTGRLLPLISKVPGSAGLTYPIEQEELVVSALRLRSINKELGFELRGDEVHTGQDIQSIVGLFPKAECISFGYQCCAESNQVGAGESLTRSVTDCPARCFPACSSLPFIEFFNSDPPFDPLTRAVAMMDGTLDVIFNYNVNPQAIKNVHIEYGDGSNQDSDFAEGIFTHTYSCTAACSFTATLKITDEKGISSVESDLSKIYIIKR